MTVHPDHKIGLALAVLIIGFAGAFCFRNEPIDPPQPLSPDRSLQLDREIALLPVRAYLAREGVHQPLAEVIPGLPRSLEDGGRNALVAGAEAARGDTLQPAPGAPEPIPIVITPPAGRESPGPGDVQAGVERPPAPLRIEPRSHLRPQARRPPSRQGPSPSRPQRTSHPQTLPPPTAIEVPGEAAPLSPHSGRRHTIPERAEGAFRPYVVQPGDTLSGLAARFLGSSGRYREIYERNRDVLRSPDDLSAGTLLQIPDERIASED